MRGMMMDTQLTITMIMRHAEKVYPDSEITSVMEGNKIHRYTFGEAFSRVRKLANALNTLGVKPGDRIATLAWNDYRHFELYYGISCSGLVCHTINPRLFDEQIEYIINHAEDQWIFISPDFIDKLESIQDRLPTVKGFVLLTDRVSMPESSLRNLCCYEDLLVEQSAEFDWPEFEENTASALCYTSGTTGNPKGVLYSHRSSVLHSLSSSLRDSFNLSVNDVVLPLVPMFHVNGWGLMYSAPMVGANLVLPGKQMGNSEIVVDLINQEKATVSGAVPTVWNAIVDYLKASGKTLSSLSHIIIGGSACPVSLIDELRESYDVHVMHCWGMTEVSPLGALNTLKPGMEDKSKEELDSIRVKQGRPLFGVDMELVDEEGGVLPWDGASPGALMVRGPWVASGYYTSYAEQRESHGWLDTGDVAVIDQDGYLQLTDRKKDLIKSGGEWISSIELENCISSHPAVKEAAVIAVSHPQWTERPLLIVVKQADVVATKEEILRYFEGKVAKWWIPDDVLFVDNIPHTATGKISKLTLRRQFENWELSEYLTAG